MCRYIYIYSIFRDINLIMSQRHRVGDGVLFLNYFVSSLYNEYLTSEIHLKFENISLMKLKSKLYNRLKIEYLHIRRTLLYNNNAIVQ